MCNVTDLLAVSKMIVAAFIILFNHRKAPWHARNIETSCLHFYRMFKQDGRAMIASLKQKLLKIKRALVLNFANKNKQVNNRWLLKESIVYSLESTKEWNQFMFLESESISYLYHIRIKNNRSIFLFQERYMIEDNFMENTSEMPSFMPFSLRNCNSFPTMLQTSILTKPSLMIMYILTCPISYSS